MAHVHDQGRLLKEEAKHAGLCKQTIWRRRKLAQGLCRDCIRPRYLGTHYCHLHLLLQRFASRVRKSARPIGRGGR